VHLSKQAFFILLSAVVLLEGMSFLIVETGFQWNQKYIADKLCVNRFDQCMHCNGMCYLKNQLQGTASNQSAGQKSVPQIIPLVWYIESQTEQNPWLPEEKLTSLTISLSYFFNFHFSIEHPPSA
jgi:hypothetical protein